MAGHMSTRMLAAGATRPDTHPGAPARELAEQILDAAPRSS
ncbi:hypothetical protein ACQP25_37020 [Microtetraspora malaysiensis]